MRNARLICLVSMFIILSAAIVHAGEIEIRVTDDEGTRTPLSENAEPNDGYAVTSELWMRAVLKVSENPIDLVWTMVGADITPSGDQVVSGYFYADPDDFAYGSPYNPEVFVKIYITSSGWCNIAVNHVTVDDVDVYTAHHYSGSADQTGTVSLTNRLLEHQYNGVAIDNSLANAVAASNSDDISATAGGYILSSCMWAQAILQVPGNPVTLIWKAVGSDTTPSGDLVVSGYYYADPDIFAYGSPYNPEVFVKVYISTSGWANIAFNHVTVDDIAIASAHPYGGSIDQSATASLASRLVEHQYDGVQMACIDISKFIGQYDIQEISAGTCEYTYRLVIGNEFEKIEAFENIQDVDYLYLDPSEMSFTYSDGHIAVEILDADTIHVSEKEGVEESDYRFRFSENYNKIESSGTLYIDVPDWASCNGNVIGEGKRIIPSLVGSWGPGYANDYQNGGSNFVSLTFYPNGHYIHWQSDKRDESGDMGGGVEYGSYTYDPTTGYGTIHPLVDENGSIGLADDGDDSSGYSLVKDDTLYIDSLALERVQSEASLIVGSWGPGHANDYQNGGSNFVSLTFYPNGHYIHWQSDKRDESGDMGGGVEYGSYTYDPATGYVTIHPIVDENGTIGLADYGEDSAGYVQVDEDTLRFGENVFQRVAAK